MTVLDAHTLSVRALTEALLSASDLGMPVLVHAALWKRPIVGAMVVAVEQATGRVIRWGFTNDETPTDVASSSVVPAADAEPSTDLSVDGPCREPSDYLETRSTSEPLTAAGYLVADGPGIGVAGPGEHVEVGLAPTPQEVPPEVLDDWVPEVAALDDGGDGGDGGAERVEVTEAFVVEDVKPVAQQVTHVHIDTINIETVEFTGDVHIDSRADRAVAHAATTGDVVPPVGSAAADRDLIPADPLVEASFAMLAFQQPVMVDSLRPRPAGVPAQPRRLAPSAGAQADILRELASIEAL